MISTPQSKLPPAASPRGANQLIADAYDALVYDPPGNPLLDPDSIFSLASLHGCARNISRKFDTLDLGCGTAQQLERAALQSKGLVVGLDIAPKPCAIARERLARFGGRAQILCKDFSQVDARNLGAFELLYHIGVIYITPPEVQRHLIDIIAQCLAPGGVAVISYYVGAIAKLRGDIHRRLRECVDPKASFETQIKNAREKLESMRMELPPDPSDNHPMALAIRQTGELDDIVFYHEVLNQAFFALDTSWIEAQLAPRGIEFLNYAPGQSFGALASSQERAGAADAFDAQTGGYRYALFGKVGEASSAADARRPNVRWSSRLVHPSVGAFYRGPATWRDPHASRAVQINHVETQAALDELTTGPKNFAQLQSGARARLSRAGVKPGNDAGAKIAGDLLQLTWNGFVMPLWKEA